MQKNNYIILSIVTMVFLLISIVIYILGNKNDNDEIKITIDNIFYKQLDELFADEEVELYKFDNYTINGDASITYTLTEEEQEKALANVGEYIDKIILDYLNNYDTYSIYNININEDFTKFDIYISDYSDLEKNIIQGEKVAIFCVYYQYIKGRKLKNIDVELTFIDNYTDEILLQTTFKEKINIE